jgi:hypothetical protein
MRIKANEFELMEPQPDAFDIYDGETYGECDEEVPSGFPEPAGQKKTTTMQIVVWVCLLNGIAWVWCSYILAWLGKEQIAESLSQVALTEIIGVVLVYAVKSVVENLSKNNSWPDKNASGPG